MRSRSVRALSTASRPGRYQEYLDLTRLKEEPAQQYDARGMIAALLADHEALIRNLRGDLRACSEECGG